MSTENLVTARVSHHFDAPAERVFDAFMNVESARRFLYATNAGEIVRAELDPRVGGAYVMTDLRNGIHVEHNGTFQEIDRPHHLVFTMFVPGYSRVPDTVTVTITPSGDGCDLELTHTMQPDYAPFVEVTEQAYTEHLGRLDAMLGE